MNLSSLQPLLADYNLDSTTAPIRPIHSFSSSTFPSADRPSVLSHYYPPPPQHHHLHLHMSPVSLTYIITPRLEYGNELSSTKVEEGGRGRLRKKELFSKEPPSGKFSALRNTPAPALHSIIYALCLNLSSFNKEGKGWWWQSAALIPCFASHGLLIQSLRQIAAPRDEK